MPQNSLISQFLPALKLIAGEETPEDDQSLEPLQALWLKFIFEKSIPNEELKRKYKTDILELISTIQNNESKEFNTSLLTYALEDPYETYINIKKKYPAWLVEYLLFMWDTSGMLNDEAFNRAENSHGPPSNTTIIERGTGEYVNYLISLK